MKCVITQSNTQNNLKSTRYSTNPTNYRNKESQEKILKFDDFVKNFDTSKQRLMKLKADQEKEAALLS